MVKMANWIILGALLFGVTGTIYAEEDLSAKYLISVITGKASYAYFGSAVQAGADWTGTGKKLIAVGASGGMGEYIIPIQTERSLQLIAVGASGGMGEVVQQGAVYLFDTLADKEPVVTLKGVEEGDLFGYRLSGGKDINGDGIPDLAVSAPYGRTGLQKVGKVYLFMGGSEFATAKPLALSAGESGDGFGLSICMDEDLNGDGLMDLVVGAPYSNRGGAVAGTAYIWLGGKALKNGAKPDIVLRQGTTNDMFGTSLSAGDLNGDGQADLVVGSPVHNIGETLPGAVFVYYGGSKAKWETPSLVINGEATGFQDHFGASVKIVGDVNGDGSSDLLVSAPRVKIAAGDEGRVYLYQGGQSFDATPDQVFSGRNALCHFGSAIHAAGDLNKDGKADFIIQEEDATEGHGILHFYYGGWETAFYEMTGERTGDRLGNSVVPLGDFNGDGTEDLAIGARWNDANGRDAGRVYILSFPH
jgi:hypothetical protein